MICNKHRSGKNHLDTGEVDCGASNILWWQPRGGDWLPFLPSTVLPSGSFVVSHVCQNWSEPPFVVVVADPERLVFGTRTDEFGKTIPSSNVCLHCKICFGEMNEEERCDSLLCVHVGQLLHCKSLVLDVPTCIDNQSPGNLMMPTLSLRLSRIKKAECIQNADFIKMAECRVWFQPVGGIWQPFLPGTVLPSESFVIAKVCQNWGEPPFIVVASDPQQLAVGVWERWGLAPALFSLFCKISLCEMMEKQRNPTMVGMQIGERIACLSVVLDTPATFKNPIQWQSTFPTLSLRPSRIAAAEPQVTKPAVIDGDNPHNDDNDGIEADPGSTCESFCANAAEEEFNDGDDCDPFDQGGEDDYPVNGTENTAAAGSVGKSCSNENNHTLDSCRERPNNGYPDSNGDVEIASVGCLPSLSTILPQHQHPSGSTLEVPFPFSTSSGNLNQPKKAPVSRSVTRRNTKRKASLEQRSASANDQQTILQNNERIEEERERSVKAKEEEDQKNAKTLWKRLFCVPQHDPGQLQGQEHLLQEIGLSSESFQSLTDPDREVNGDVIDYFFKMLHRMCPRTNHGFFSSVVVPRFLNGTSDDKKQCVSDKNGACLYLTTTLQVLEKVHTPNLSLKVTLQSSFLLMTTPLVYFHSKHCFSPLSFPITGT